MYLKPSEVGGPSLPQLPSERSPTTVRIIPGWPSAKWGGKTQLPEYPGYEGVAVM